MDNPYCSSKALRHEALGAVQVPSDPAREWEQIFHETWRLWRDIFYAENMHGPSLSRVDALHSAATPTATR